MKEKRIPTQAGSSSRWEQLEECMREHVQQFIQALWLEGFADGRQAADRS